ncbi:MULTISPECIES: hypothetical protein [Halorussus]|uniref:hypothetical protein n=1 Tax=Halorussus TaxID=1070314 RepID=UPI00209DEFF9|nr:hypothetical protein [Halorussus vallis]USZ75162.1 hypothetical protein NGM07_17225 [Halorussus vallis]
MRSAIAVLVVLALVASAGLTGSIVAPATEGPASAPSTESPTTEPSSTTPVAATDTTDRKRVATPTGTTTRKAVLPPGVNGTAVENSSALVAAHRSVLNATGFAFRFRSNVSVGSSYQTTEQRGFVGAGLDPLVLHSESVRHLDNETSRVGTDIWANDTDTVVRYARHNETQLRHFNRTGDNLGVPDETLAHLPRADLESQVTQTWLLELALSSGTFERVAVERRSGRPVVVLEATKAADANVSKFDATLVVSPSGRVTSLNMTAVYDAANGTERTRVHYAFELAPLSADGVERPSWVSAAIPKRNATNGTTTVATTTVTSGTTTATTRPSNRTTTAETVGASNEATAARADVFSGRFGE